MARKQKEILPYSIAITSTNNSSITITSRRFATEEDALDYANIILDKLVEYDTLRYDDVSYDDYTISITNNEIKEVQDDIKGSIKAE